MGIVTVKSDLYRAEQTGGPVPDALKVKGVLRRATGKVFNAASDSAGSIYKLIKLRSDVILTERTLFHNAGWGFATTQVGVLGAAAALFTKTTSASTTESPITGIEAVSGQRLWEQLGLSADPRGEIELVAIAAANATGAGSMPFAVEWIDDL
ncbi:hypothetical protein CNY89_07515 [Amaricoccus sp. HAR-UPW-R2A-40]|nr:hypothetical protein CNY89_07515 [Amaricoccus sp. HAR-UPW-R2A-40]